MKRILAASISLVVAAAGGLAAHAATSGTPEIDRANATFQLSGRLSPVNCVGEDGTSYMTFKGTFKGGTTQVLPDPTDYGLSGTATISGIKWTINLGTKRGVLTGAIGLVDSTGLPQYSGKITLITQGVPAPGTAVPGRGWIVAGFVPADEGVTPGDDNLLANVEFSLSPTGAGGQFGDAAGSGSLGFPDFSGATNVAPTAPDGTC